MSASPAKLKLLLSNNVGDACTITEFTAISNWIEVDDFSTIDGLGDQSDIHETIVDQLDRPIKEKHTTIDDYVSINCVRSLTDPGQLAFMQARSEAGSRAFKIVDIDGSPIYFSGLTFAHQLIHDQAQSIIYRSFKIARTSPIIEA